MSAKDDARWEAYLKRKSRLWYLTLADVLLFVLIASVCFLTLHDSDHGDMAALLWGVAVVVVGLSLLAGWITKVIRKRVMARSK